MRSREGSRGGEDRESREDWGNQQHNSTDWEAAARNWMQHQAPSTLEEPTPPELGSLLTRLGGAGTDSETEGSRKLDLDTRLQMLMKDKSANMPAFLIGSDSSEDEAVAPAPPPPIVAPPPPPPALPSAVTTTPSLPLSRDPSPL